MLKMAKVLGAAVDVWSARHAPYWLDLRDMGNSPLTRTSILIPLVGYWIIFNDQLVTASKLSNSLVANNGDGPSWRLFATYFGLCFIAVASVVYQWRCPRQIKHHSTDSSYVGKMSTEMSGIELQRIDIELQNGDGESKARFAGLMRAWPSLQPEDVESHRNSIKESTLQLYFDLCNRSSPSARLVTFVCNRIGLFALLVPSTDIFVRVTAALARQLARFIH